MFRHEEVIAGGWREKTVEAMQRRRFETMVAQLPPLSVQRLSALSSSALKRRIECSWQGIEKKPMRSMQFAGIKERVLAGIKLHADCLSREEHYLVERALILGGSAQIEDIQELEAAQALSLRLWASVGMVSGKPYMELEPGVMQPAAVAMARREHDMIRQRFEEFSAKLSFLLYQAGAVDDRIPQQMIIKDVLCDQADMNEAKQLARRYLWASCDCVDYEGSVMLLHPALAEPHALLGSCRRIGKATMESAFCASAVMSILPEEIPLQSALERAIEGAMREGRRPEDVARDIRFLCKQGAPLDALEDVLQASLIVHVNAQMRFTLENMFYMTPKWIESTHNSAAQ